MQNTKRNGRRVILTTTLEQIKQDLDMIKAQAKAFFLEHSIIEYHPHDNEFIIGFSDYYWGNLNPDGKKAQAKLYKDYSYFVELMGIMLSELPPDYLNNFEEARDSVMSSIKQDGQVWGPSTLEVLNEVIKYLDKQFSLLSFVFDHREEKVIFVPDTNALLTNPYLDRWHFADVVNFEILLTPSVLSELDQLKVVGRNEEVRTKSQNIIKNIKEYRRRGKLTEGVTLRKGLSTIRALAVEPNFKQTFSWLKEENKDDRLLASFVEIIKTYPNSIVQLVTADINLQNKAEYARLSFIEPPGIEE